MRIQFFLILLWTPLIGLSQSVEDSLLARLKNVPETELDTIYYQLLKNGVMNGDQDFVKLMRYADSAYYYAEKFDSKQIQVRAVYGKAFIYNKQFKPDSSFIFLEKAKALAFEYNTLDRLSYIFELYGINYILREKYDSAIHSYLNVIKYAQRFNDKRRESLANNQIGLIYLRSEEYSIALDYFNKSLKIKENYGFLETINTVKLNIGYCLILLDRINKANEFFGKLYDNWIDKSINSNKGVSCTQLDKSTLSGLYLGLGIINIELRNFEESFNYLLEAKNIIDDNFVSKKVSIYKYLGIVHQKLSSIDSAFLYLDSSIYYAKKHDLPKEISSSYHELSRLYEDQHDLDKALHYERLSSLYADSAKKRINIPGFTDPFVEFEKYKGDIEIQKKEASIRRNRQLAILLGMIAFLSLTVFALVHKVARVRKKLNEKLSDKVFDRTQELNTFLYRSSHDLAGPLATMKGLINLIEPHGISEDHKKYIERMNLTTVKLDRIIHRLESIGSISTRPLRNEKVDLLELSRNAIKKVQNGYSVIPEISVQGNTYATSDPELLSGILISLLENSFNNIDRREQDQKISITFINNKDLQLTITDTGTGIIEGQENKIFEVFFTGYDKSERAGIGLYFAKIAAERLGGTIFLKNSKKPTVFEVKLPKR